MVSSIAYTDRNQQKLQVAHLEAQRNEHLEGSEDKSRAVQRSTQGVCLGEAHPETTAFQIDADKETSIIYV